MDEETGGVNGRFDACSAMRACLTTLKTDAKKAGEG